MKHDGESQLLSFVMKTNSYHIKLFSVLVFFF